METCKKLGRYIKQLREERQISMKDLSDKTGIRVQYLQKIENGKAFGMLLETHLLKIVGALNIKLGELFKFEDLNNSQNKNH